MTRFRAVCDGCQQVRFCVEDEFGENICTSCAENKAEAAYERSQSEAFRGGEAASYLASQQAAAKRLK